MDALGCCAAVGKDPLASLAVVVFGGVAFAGGRACADALLLGGSPGISVRELGRLGNGGSAEKLQSSAAAVVALAFRRSSARTR
jgi:hypothetical protein